MDGFVTSESERFVWDSDKAATNLVKQGVSFDRALDVFFDPLHDVWDASVPGERRAAAISRAYRKNLLYVVHLEVEYEATRIISARLATPAKTRDDEESE